MTGLRSWTRDAEIPARAGEPELCPHPEADVARLFADHLVADGAPALGSVTWEYARWKPGVSVTAAYRLAFDDGAEELAVVKHYRGDKAAILAEREVRAGEPPGLSGRLRARAFLPEARTALWAPAADRELELRYLLDRERFAKLLREEGVVAAGLVRRRRTEFELLRYKPERRAVHRVRLALRDEGRTRFSLAARALPPAEGARVIAARRAFEAQGGGELAPTVTCAHERGGVVVEPWLELETNAPDDFTSAPRAGALLARLHALDCDAPSSADARPPLGDLAPLFTSAPDLARGLDALAWPEPAGRPAWIHGDFHPDQTAVAARGPTLLDLDALGAGEPARDLANWIADHLFEAPDRSFETAAGPLLAAYAAAGGRPPEDARLRRLTACELASRAAASFRRLERGAPDRARTALERALDLG